MPHHILQKSVLTSLAAIILSGCTQAGIFAANLPLAFNDVKIVRNVSYGDLDAQKLDLYIPQHTQRESLPVLVFFYGGRWEDGQKSQYRFLGNSFAQEGYIVAIPDYRKYPAVKFPAFLEDAGKAIAWVHDEISDYGGNPEALYVAGHSSGAHIGALVSTDPKYLGAYGKERSIIIAFAGLAGPYDFTPEEPDLKDMFGPPENYPNMQVPTFVDGAQPPMLLLQGAADETVYFKNAKSLNETIQKRGGMSETKLYPGINHVEIVGALTWFWQYKAPVRKDIITFFERIKS